MGTDAFVRASICDKTEDIFMTFIISVWDAVRFIKSEKASLMI